MSENDKGNSVMPDKEIIRAENKSIIPRIERKVAAHYSDNLKMYMKDYELTYYLCQDGFEQIRAATPNTKEVSSLEKFQEKLREEGNKRGVNIKIFSVKDLIEDFFCETKRELKDKNLDSLFLSMSYLFEKQEIFDCYQENKKREAWPEKIIYIDVPNEIDRHIETAHRTHISSDEIFNRFKPREK